MAHGWPRIWPGRDSHKAEVLAEVLENGCSLHQGPEASAWASLQLELMSGVIVDSGS